MPDVSQAPKGSSKDEATERTSLQSLLIAARLQAERGEEAQCLKRLQKAHELLHVLRGTGFGRVFVLLVEAP